MSDKRKSRLASWEGRNTPFRPLCDRCQSEKDFGKSCNVCHDQHRLWIDQIKNPNGYWTDIYGIRYIKFKLSGDNQTYFSKIPKFLTNHNSKITPLPPMPYKADNENENN